MAPRPFIPVPGTVELEFVFDYNTIFMVNRFFVFWPLADRPDDAAASIAALAGFWASVYYLPLLASQVNFQHTRCRTCDTASDPWVVNSDYAGNGSDTSGAMSANVAVLVRWTVPLNRRNRPGHTFVPAPPRAQITENEVSASYRSGLIDAFSTLIDFADFAGGRLCMVSFRHNNAWRSEGVPFEMELVQPQLVVTQRRRRLKNTLPK